MSAPPPPPDGNGSTARPRLGFLGVGWIGLHRMRAILEDGSAQIAAIADPDEVLLKAAAEVAPHAELGADLEFLLENDLEAIVIATPSALHSVQSIAALRAGLAVF